MGIDRWLCSLFVPPPFCRSLCSHRTPFHLQCLAAEYRATDEAPVFDRRLKYFASQMRRISVSRMGSMPSRRSCSALLPIPAVRSVIFIVYFYCSLCVTARMFVERSRMFVEVDLEHSFS